MQFAFFDPLRFHFFFITIFICNFILIKIEIINTILFTCGYTVIVIEYKLLNIHIMNKNDFKPPFILYQCI